MKKTSPKFKLGHKFWIATPIVIFQNKKKQSVKVHVGTYSYHLEISQINTRYSLYENSHEYDVDYCEDSPYYHYDPKTYNEDEIVFTTEAEALKDASERAKRWLESTYPQINVFR